MERIDVHCHAVAPGYRQYALDHGHDRPDGMPALPVRKAYEQPQPNRRLINIDMEPKPAHRLDEEIEHHQINIKHHLARNPSEHK
jgi:hypothetical protein